MQDSYPVQHDDIPETPFVVTHEQQQALRDWQDAIAATREGTELAPYVMGLTSDGTVVSVDEAGHSARFAVRIARVQELAAAAADQPAQPMTYRHSRMRNGETEIHVGGSVIFVPPTPMDEFTPRPMPELDGKKLFPIDDDGLPYMSEAWRSDVEMEGYAAMQRELKGRQAMGRLSLRGLRSMFGKG
jgi:hypothetical protein